MSILSVQTPYVDGATVTSTNLNALVTDASFTSSAVDNSTTQLSGTAIVVRDGGIDKDKLETSIKGIIELVGTSYLGGDKTGNTRGASSLDIQSKRASATQVASGYDSTAVGISNTVSANYGNAFGRKNTVSGDVSNNAIGTENTVTGQASSGFGYKNATSGSFSSAFGYNNTASQAKASAFGYANTASGNYSSSFGRSNTASNYYSNAFGLGNTASGFESSAFGLSNTASAYNAVAIGKSNIASFSNSSALGRSNTASASYSVAVGQGNTSSGQYSAAIGQETTASGTYSIVLGRKAKSTVLSTTEIGSWSDATTRAGGIRLHPNGQHAVTIANSASAPTDGGATAGSEANGTLPRGMFAIQKNGNVVTFYYNNGGTIQSLPVGTLT